MLRLLVSDACCRRCGRLCLVRQRLPAAADAGWAVGHLARRARPAVGSWSRPVQTRHRGRRVGRRAPSVPSHGCGRSRRRDAFARPTRQPAGSSARPTAQSADVSP